MHISKKKSIAATASEQPPAEKSVRKMFGEIAESYDRLNRLMTFGQDRVWRRCVVETANFPNGGKLLDTGTGTGSIAMEALQGDDSMTVVGSDFTPEMMMVGKQRANGQKVCWVAADALSLPFPDACFDAVTSGYLIRNVSDAHRAFQEQTRVVKPGGRVVCLETSPPPDGPLRPAIRFFLDRIIPLMGQLISGNRSAYTYLPQTTQGFMAPPKVSAVMRAAGLRNIRYRQFMFGTIAVHIGIRPR